jgi:hypothetical protein
MIKDYLFIIAACFIPIVPILTLLYFYPLDMNNSPLFVIPVVFVFLAGYYIFLRIFKINELNWIKEKIKENIQKN